ncbi:MAG: hypothetical protein FK734_02900 [Asgard group archaeon]|nr:hypothetical protein [Asgard group archaeon]
MSEKKEYTKKKILEETDENHPELKPIQIAPKRYRHRTKHIPKELIIRFNQPVFTYVLLASACFLGVVYIIFGILGALTIVGIKPEKIWGVYEATAIFGWDGQAITGFALIIIGIVILWSVPHYFLDKMQKADSYLIIGSGLGVLFGVIYLLIILTDVLQGVIEGLSASIPITIQTYFYTPIMISIFAMAIFRMLAIRHMIVPEEEAAQISEVDAEVVKPVFVRRFNHDFWEHRRNRYREWRKRWRKKR